MPGIDEVHLEAACLEDFVDGDPIDPGRLHRHAGDPARRQPVRQPMEIGRERRKRSHGRGVAIGWHGHEMFGGAAINSGDVRVDPLQHRGRHTGLARATATIVFHRMLLHTAQSIREQGGGCGTFS